VHANQGRSVFFVVINHLFQHHTPDQVQASQTSRLNMCLLAVCQPLVNTCTFSRSVCHLPDLPLPFFGLIACRCTTSRARR
jgi:hypothetical protein